MRNRKLNLKREVLADLTANELGEVGAGQALTTACFNDTYICVSVGCVPTYTCFYTFTCS